MVQFKYGDDGLDPVMIEGDQQPVDFLRALKHVIVTFFLARLCSTRMNPRLERTILMIKSINLLGRNVFINFRTNLLQN